MALLWTATEVSYGIGFRFHSTNTFIMRIDLAKSREGVVSHYSTDVSS